MYVRSLRGVCACAFVQTWRITCILVCEAVHVCLLAKESTSCLHLIPILPAYMNIYTHPVRFAHGILDLLVLGVGPRQVGPNHAEVLLWLD